MNKIVVLNSGGFDSIVMCHYVRDSFPNAEIHSLHFNYGERNMKEQDDKVHKACQKLGMKEHTLHLPVFKWTTGEFYEKGYNPDKQYLEYRNLVFLSYAISYAESIKAEGVYLALVYDNEYTDTNEVFLESMNNIAKQSGIEIYTPLRAFKYKEEMLPLALKYHLKPTDYFSCDNPKSNGTPCGTCLDCVALSFLEEKLTIDTPMKALHASDFNYRDVTFVDLLKKEPFERLNLSMASCEVSSDRLIEVIKEAVSLGMKELHLYQVTKDSHLFILSHPEMPQGIDIIVHTFAEDFPHIDGKFWTLEWSKIKNIVLEDTLFDCVQQSTWDALASCKELGIIDRVHLDFYISPYEENTSTLYSILDGFLNSFPEITGVHIFATAYTRTTTSYTKPQIVSGLDNVYLSLMDCAEKYKNTSFTYDITIDYADLLSDIRFTTRLSKDLLVANNESKIVNENLVVHLEQYCSHCSNREISIDTHTGFVYGCRALMDYGHTTSAFAHIKNVSSLADIMQLKASKLESSNTYLDSGCRKCRYKIS